MPPLHSHLTQVSQPGRRAVTRVAARTLAPGALLAMAAAWGSATGDFPRSPSSSPDLVLYRGRIHTVDSTDTTVEALAIAHGRILARGTDREMLALARHGTRRIDLEGRAATPGLIDAHAHISDAGLAALYHVDLSEARSIADVVSRVHGAIARLKPGEWLQGDGWDEGKLAEHRYVTTADLDPVSPANPVWLLHTTGHYGVANTLALRQAHIDRNTPDPPAATIDRDAARQPTGVLKESAAMNEVMDRIPPTTPAQLRAGIVASLDLMHREGMTAVKDPDIGRPVWDAYTELLQQGALRAHVCVLFHAGSTLESARAALAEIQQHPRPPA